MFRTERSPALSAHVEPLCTRIRGVEQLPLGASVPKSIGFGTAWVARFSPTPSSSHSQDSGGAPGARFGGGAYTEACDL